MEHPFDYNTHQYPGLMHKLGASVGDWRFRLGIAQEKVKDGDSHVLTAL